MGRRLPSGAEVLGSPYQTPAKELLPHAVDGHARRERILFGQDPLGKVEPRRPIPGLCPAQKIRRTRRDFDARAVPLAPQPQIGLARTVALPDHARFAELRVGGL